MTLQSFQANCGRLQVLLSTFLAVAGLAAAAGAWLPGRSGTLRAGLSALPDCFVGALAEAAGACLALALAAEAGLEAFAAEALQGRASRLRWNG